VRTHVNFTQYVSLAHGCCFGRPTFGGNWLQVTHARLNLGGASWQKIGKKARWTKRRLRRLLAPAFLPKFAAGRGAKIDVLTDRFILKTIKSLASRFDKPPLHRFLLLIGGHERKRWHFAPRLLLTHSHSIYICQEFGPSAPLPPLPPPPVSKNNQIQRRPTCEHHCSKINNRKVAASEFIGRFFPHPERTDVIRKRTSPGRRLANIETLFCGGRRAFSIRTHTRRTALEKTIFVCFFLLCGGFFWSTTFLDIVDGCFVFLSRISGGHKNFRTTYFISLL